MFDYRRDPRSVAVLVALLGCIGCSGGEGDADAGNGDGGIDDGGTDAATSEDAGEPDAGSSSAGGDPSVVCNPPTLAGRLEAGSWDPRFTMPGVLGFDGYVPNVHGFTHEADGSLLVTGYFQWAGSDLVGPVARLRTGGAWERLRDDLLSDSISAVAVDGARAAFSTFVPLLPDPSAPPQSGSIVVDVGDGLRRIESFEGIVRALAWVDGRLWVGGHFSMDGGPAGLAVWDETSGWSAPPGGPVNGPVYTMLVEGSEVIVGGSFTSVGGITARSVAAFDGTAWRALSMEGFRPEPYAVFTGGPIVFGLTRDDSGDLYAGGSFFPVGADAGGVARWNGSGWEPIGGLTAYGGLAGDSPAVVSDIAFFEGQLWATGCVDGTPGSEARLPGVARWSGTAWEAPPGSEAGAPLSSPWYFGWGVCGAEPSGKAIMEATFQRLTTHDGRLYVGGSFPAIGRVASQSLIAHDGEGWVAVGDTSGLGLAGNVSEIAVGDPECGVYQLVPPAVGAPDELAVYRFDGDAWSALPGGRPDGELCTQLAVSAAGDVYLGCETPWGNDGTPPVPRVYRHDGSAWAPLGDIEGVDEGSIWDMAFDPAGRLWIVGGAITGFLARWDGRTWTTIESGFDAFVSHISFEPGDSGRFVVGGGFTSIGSVAARRIARWDGSQWEALGEGFDTPLNALAYATDAIYVSSTPGDPSVGDVQWILARWDGTAWEELGTEERGLAPHIAHERGGIHQIDTIFVSGNDIVVAGGIYPVGTSGATGGRNVFVFDGERFQPLAGGVGAINVDAMAVTPDALLLGGFLATAGGGDQLMSSIGIARFRLAP